jgi:hypothetical protein
MELEGVNVSRCGADSGRRSGSDARSDWKSRSRAGGAAGSSRTAGAGTKGSSPLSASDFAALVLRGRGVTVRFFLVSPVPEARADGLSSSVFGGSAMSGWEIRGCRGAARGQTLTFGRQRCDKVVNLILKKRG